MGSNWSVPQFYLTIDANRIGSNGANISFPLALGIPDDPENCLASEGCDADKNSWIIGIVNACPYLAIFVL